MRDKPNLLSKKFFERSAVVVVRELIGCFLCRKIKRKTQKFMIVETEAYEGLKDKASHASRGETARNKVMFGEAGVWYVYFTYGMHHMLNIVCDSKGHPAAVLIRGIVSKNGEKFLGPARLTKKLSIGKNFNEKTASKKTGLWIEPRSLKIAKLKIENSPRIGVAYSGPVWSKKLYRFVLEGFETKRFK